MPRSKSVPLSQRPSQSQASRADSDDEQTQQQTQNQTQANKAYSSISAEDRERKICELVQYVLVSDQKKLSIKRQDINRHVLKEHSKAFPILIQEAKTRLSDVFGFDLIELQGKQKAYVLANKYETSHMELSTSEKQRRGLLMVVLSAIFMNGNIMADGPLYYMLKKLDVDIDKSQHPVFGDVKKLITQEFVRQGYLEMTRQPTSDPPAYEFHWGQRAKHEVSKRNCLKFVTDVYGMADQAQWHSQWQEANAESGAAVAGD